MDYIVKARGLCKSYGHFKALSDFSINVPKGAVYGFVGKNGAGKTTFIRILCGLQKPSAGEYFIYGTSGTSPGIGRVRRRMGAVVETLSLYMSMSAEDNLKTQYRLLGMPSFKTIPELLSLVGLENTGRKKAKNFSLGMKQRLGIAMALAQNPDLLVLDEPVNGLDPQGIVEIRELILKLNREKQITVLISSHILDELSRLATHYGFIDKGRMVKEISAAELEAACRKCVRVRVSDIKALAGILHEKNLPYEIISDTEADIFERVNVSELAVLCGRRGCEILSMTEREESLESYYVNLVGGDEK